MQQVKYFCAPIAAPIPKGVFSGTIFFKFKLARKVHLSLMPFPAAVQGSDTTLPA